MKARNEAVKIQISGNVDVIPALRKFIARLGYNFGFDDYESHQIEVVADEICENAIEHGSKEKDGVEVECLFSKGQIELIVTDNGNKEFNIKELFTLNRKRIERGWGLEELNLRGRGLIIVQALVDELKIKTLPNKGTTVRVIKRHKPEGERKKEFVFPNTEGTEDHI